MLCILSDSISCLGWAMVPPAGQKGNKRYEAEWQRPTSSIPPLPSFLSVSRLSSDKKCSISDPGQAELIGDPYGSTSYLVRDSPNLAFLWHAQVFMDVFVLYL